MSLDYFNLYLLFRRLNCVLHSSLSFSARFSSSARTTAPDADPLCPSSISSSSLFLHSFDFLPCLWPQASGPRCPPLCRLRSPPPLTQPLPVPLQQPTRHLRHQALALRLTRTITETRPARMAPAPARLTTTLCRPRPRPPCPHAIRRAP